MPIDTHAAGAADEQPSLADQAKNHGRDWAVWWQGSGERGDHIMEVRQGGTGYAREIAFIGPDHHDQAGTLVDAHNEQVRRLREVIGRQAAAKGLLQAELGRIKAVIPASLSYEVPDTAEAVAVTFREYVKVPAEATALRKAATASPAPGALADLRALSEAADAAKQASDAYAETNPGSTPEGFMLRMRVCNTRNAFRDAAVNYVSTLLASSPAASAPPVDGGDRERIARIVRSFIKGKSQADGSWLSTLNSRKDPEAIADAILSHPRPVAGAEGLVEAKKDHIRALKEALFACLSAGGDDHRYGGVLMSDGRKAWVRFTAETPESSAALARHATPDNDPVEADDPYAVDAIACNMMDAGVSKERAWVYATKALNDIRATRPAAQDGEDDTLALLADLKAELGTTDTASTFRAALTKAREAVAEVRAATPQGAGETAGGVRADFPGDRFEGEPTLYEAAEEILNWHAKDGSVGTLGDYISDLRNAVIRERAAAPEQAGSRGWPEPQPIGDAPPDGAWFLSELNGSVVLASRDEGAAYPWDVVFLDGGVKPDTAVRDGELKVCWLLPAARPHSDAEGRS